MTIIIQDIHLVTIKIMSAIIVIGANYINDTEKINLQLNSEKDSPTYKDISKLIQLPHSQR